MYKTGDGVIHDSYLDATMHCTHVFLTTGVVLALEEL